ncbi:Csr1p Ecym_5341 [Eremothecium cymbalariae DBVPG|uniref:CRAL-TRIO domain-containing protein n=1 Tax=Eremothecium cymbalariae (strain CBS 270.75 / DBVPG 7215 / KCTC 17166 / NRRL Y-17582) TaxID=931890 RepID=I6NDF8_ERECY|nr:hypothetical protein Ecym_5341 [Eremothecium cymbalariae DBVPG\
MDVPSGRVQNLTDKQEFHLKQVWAHIFQFWGVPVDLSELQATEKLLESNGTTNVKSDGSKNKKKLMSLFGNKKENGLNGYINGRSSSRKRESSVSVATVRSSESIESANQSLSVHESFKDLDPTELREKFWEMLRCDYPDNLLLRFVRARKWDTGKAIGMIANTLRWRLTEGLPDEIIRGGEAKAYADKKVGLIKQLELAKATVRGYDKIGNPLVFVRPKLHFSNDQTEQEIQEYSLLIIEQARLFVREPREAATIVFDLTGFSMANMDYTPVKYLISCFEAHYPECLYKLFIHKAPWIFPPIWNIIKNWLDPVVASKIVFTKNFNDLEAYISREHIPMELGGSDNYDFDGFKKVDGSSDVKLKDKEGKEKVMSERRAIIDRFIQATVSWLEAPTHEESAKWLNTKIEISKELSANYSRLDPYIRSRSFYDLNGTLKV